MKKQPYKLYKDMRKVTKKIVKKIVQSPFANILNNKICIPQNYSFILLGTHGVGFHSLLYYMSLCKTKQNQSVYPMPLHIFSRHFDLFGNFTGIRFYKKMYPIIKKDRIGSWGLTFDGGIPREKEWVRHNLKNKVPAITLIRDPILALTTTVNYEIFCNIHANLNVDIEKSYHYVLQYIKSTIGFKQNLRHMEMAIQNNLYIDCTDLMGDKTYPTMQKIANFLNLDISFHESFKHSINSPIQRYFASPIIHNQQEIYLSSFPHFFRITCYPHYFSPNYCDDLGYIHNQAYTSSVLPDQKLYLFSKKQIKITRDLQEKIDHYLATFCNILIQYNKFKITPKDFIDLAIKHNHLSHIQTMLAEETSLIPNEIIQTWEIYQHFMQLKG